MNDELLQMILAEMVEIRKLLAAQQAEKKQEVKMSAHQEELDLVDRTGISPEEYLRERARRTHGDKKRHQKATRKYTAAQTVGR